MTSPLTLADSLGLFIENRLNELHTSLPCFVTNVDYDKCLVAVQPLVRDGRGSEALQRYPEIQEVPIAVYSSSGTAARVTLPIKSGDVGVIHFSEQESSSFINGNGSTVSDPEEYAPLGLYPLYFETGINPIAKAKSISPTNIVIENESTYIEIEPSGKVKIVANAVEIEGGSSITMTADSVTINGETTVNGNASVNGNETISGNSVVGGGNTVAGVVAAGTGLTVKGKTYSEHQHSETGDGGGTTSPPI